MKKHREIIILVSLVISIMLCMTLVLSMFSMKKKLEDMHTDKRIHGTFTLHEGTFLEEHLSIDDETVQWWKSSELYKEGSIDLVDGSEKNVYRISFDDEEIVVVYYGDCLLMIGNSSSLWNKSSDALTSFERMS